MKKNALSVNAEINFTGSLFIMYIHINYRIIAEPCQGEN